MRKITMISTVTASLLLIGCGGGTSSDMSSTANSTNTSTNTSTGIGYYVDSAVKGVGYECGTETGTTDGEGKFTFEKGQDCTFRIGGLTLRTIDASKLQNNVTIFEDNNETAQLLQSLDADGNADNGIEILPETASLIDEKGIDTVPRNELEIDTLVKDVKAKNANFNGRFVSREEAIVHVEQTRTNASINSNENSNDMSGMDDNSSNGNSNDMSRMDDNASHGNSNEMGNMDDMDDNSSHENSNDMSGMNGNTMGGTSSSTLTGFNYTAFSKALAAPTLASFTVDADGYKVFALDINASTTEFFENIQTKTYGINANILGQTIRMHRGDKIKLAYTNNLSVATTIHGHGMHVPAIMDGGPVNAIQPGETWTATYTMNQRASTNWYHPHFMHKTAEHVYMGLAGFLILDDDESDALNLPKEYGVDDIPLAIQDKRFDANGQIDYSPTRMEVRMGYKSDVMMVNGVILPYVDVPAKKVRLRLLNASNASVYNLKFSDNRSFSQIAVDNSFLEKPISMTSVSLTPAERAEIVVDLTDKKGETFTLVDSNSGLDIMQIRVTKDATSSSEIPTTLTTLVKDDINASVRTRKFVLNMARGADGGMHMAINGKLMDMMRIDEYVPQNEVEIWEITNPMGMTHNFHIHSTHFFPLTRNGVAVPANEQGYKDVVAMPGRSTVRVLVKMTDFPDESTGYMYHCHFLEHEDDGMMGQFAITDGRVEVNVGGSSSTGRGNGNSNGMGGGRGMN